MTASFGRRFSTLFAMSYRADPVRFVTMLVIGVLYRVLPIVSAWFVGGAVNATVEGDESRAVAFAILLAVSAAGAFVGSRISSRLSVIVIEKSTEQYDREIMRMSMSIDGIEHLENPAYLDQLEQLRYQPNQLGLNGMVATVVVWGVVQAVLVLAVLGSVDPILMLLPLFAASGVYLVRKAQDTFQAAFRESAEARRLAQHYYEVSTSLSHADEVRTLRLDKELVRRHNDEWARADRRMFTAERKAAFLTVVGALGLVFGYVGALVFVVERGIRGEASAGDVVLTVVIAGQLNQQLSVLLDMFGRLLGALTLVDRFLWLVDYAKNATVVVERPAEVAGRLAEGIRLEAVSFSYPSTNVEVLHDISLDLPAGTIVALVGDNGAGKTTLVKLLTGMYQPTSGRILVDGTPLENIEPRAWREHLSAAFQDFTRFELTLQESVGVGDLAHVEDTEPVLEGLALADGADLPSQLPAGLATELGASFEHGVQLSGGQWQKVALGRAMMRTSPLLLILDEPTASLDPSAEQHLFNRYSDLSRRAAITSGAITILISHRFSTVRMADLIVVVDDGRVVEIGSHADLVNAAGMYAELYELQAASYR